MINVALHQIMTRQQFLEWEERQIRYPDAVIICTPTQPRATMADSLVVVFEILSESTAHTDRTIKTLEYQATPSIQHYVMLEQTAIGAIIFARTADEWRSTTQGAGNILTLPEPGIEVQLDELYDRLSFAA